MSWHKYGNRKVTVDGISFDSVREARRYKELKLLLLAGEIIGLQMQVPFELVPAQYEETGEVYSKGPRKGQPKQGKCIEKSVVYVADFVYWQDGKRIVEDTKGVRTTEYIIKRKLMLHKYGIRIREV